MKATHSYTSRPFTHPSLAPTPFSAPKSALSALWVWSILTFTSPPELFAGIIQGHSPLGSWFSVICMEEPPAESSSQSIQDSLGALIGQFSLPYSPIKKTTSEFRGGSKMFIFATSPSFKSKTVPFCALKEPGS